MSRKWAIIIIFTIVTVSIWSGYSVYKAFSSEKDLSEYAKYAASIDTYFDEDLLQSIQKKQEKVVIKSSEIEPETDN